MPVGLCETKQKDGNSFSLHAVFKLVFGDFLITPMSQTLQSSKLLNSVVSVGLLSVSTPCLESVIIYAFIAKLRLLHFTK